MPTYQIGRVGQVYVAEESSYGTAPGFASADAIRHLNVNLNYNPRNRVRAATRHIHPSEVYRRTRRASGNWNLRGEFFPSGTLNTLPDHSEILEHGFGAKRNITLSTTVTGSPSPTATVFTVGSVTGLAVDDAILISIASTGLKYVRFITAINTLALTVAPALPVAPAAADTVKGCVSYAPATAIAKALNIGHYLTSLSYQGYGCVVDQLKIQFDANNEVMWEASGPMKSRVRPAATSQPVAFTTAGTTPPSGLTGGMVVNATAEDYLKAEIVITNGMMLDNFAGGTSSARGYYRKGVRQVEVNINSMVSDDVSIIDLADASTQTPVLLQAGDTEGSIVAVYCPLVEFDTPDDPNSDEELEWAYKGHPASVIGGNREIFLAVA